MVTTFTLDPFKDPFFADWNKTFGSAVSAPVKSYPPYNVVKVSDDHLVMEFAIAGFAKSDVDVSVEKNVLSIKGEKSEEDEKDYLHKGIAARKFTRAFTLPEYYEVEGASVDNGILYIDLVRNIPEEKKPKSIKIK